MAHACRGSAQSASTLMPDHLSRIYRPPLGLWSEIVSEDFDCVMQAGEALQPLQEQPVTAAEIKLHPQ